MKFKIGDVVRVKDNLVAGERYFNEDKSASNNFSDMMADYKGEEFEIVDIRHEQYVLEGARLFLFTDDMLELASAYASESEYVSYDEVEELIAHMLRLAPKQLMNHALDSKDEELFRILTNNSVDKSIK
jgi:hypothetical protein